MEHPGGYSSTQMRQGDWACPACQFHNFASRAQCYKCQTHNPDPNATPVPYQRPDHYAHHYLDSGPGAASSRPGDWNCPSHHCGFHNYASRSHCLRCGANKLAHRGNYPNLSLNGPQHPYGGGGGGGSAPRPGDWTCVDCQFNNFASRGQCFKCGGSTAAPPGVVGRGVYEGGGESGGGGGGGGGGGYGAAGKFRQGDWYCPACSSHNFTSRDQCLRCYADRPASVPAANPSQHLQQQHQDVKPGDWMCQSPSCGFHNFAKRSACAKCGTAAPIQARPPPTLREFGYPGAPSQSPPPATTTGMAIDRRSHHHHHQHHHHQQHDPAVKLEDEEDDYREEYPPGMARHHLLHDKRHHSSNHSSQQHDRQFEEETHQQDLQEPIGYPGMSAYMPQHAYSNGGPAHAPPPALPSSSSPSMFYSSQAPPPPGM